MTIDFGVVKTLHTNRCYIQWQLSETKLVIEMPYQLVTDC